MTTKVAWIIPSNIEVGDGSEFEFDFTEISRSIIKDEVWNRQYAFGNMYNWQFHASSEIESFKIMNLDHRDNQRELPARRKEEDIEKLIRNNLTDDDIDAAVLRQSNLADFDLPLFSSLLVAVLELNSESKWPEERQRTETKPTAEERNAVESALNFHYMCIGLIREMLYMFKAAVTLEAKSDWMIFPGKANLSISGGMNYYGNSGRSFFSLDQTDEFTFPVHMANTDNCIESGMHQLSTIWGKNLWPIFRYIKAHRSLKLEMDDILHLLFAFEGLFNEKASSDYMRFLAATISSGSMKEYCHHTNILKKSFALRNNIVHGGKEFTGQESVKIDGEDLNYDRLFWKLREIVMKLIKHSMDYMLESPEKRNLRVDAERIVRAFHGAA